MRQWKAQKDACSYTIVCLLRPLPSRVSGAPRSLRGCFRSPEKREKNNACCADFMVTFSEVRTALTGSLGSRFRFPQMVAND